MNATLIHITSFKLSVVLVQNMVYTPRFIHHLEYRLYFPENLREGEKKNLYIRIDRWILPIITWRAIFSLDSPLIFFALIYFNYC